VDVPERMGIPAVLTDGPERAQLTVEVLTRRTKSGIPAASWFLYLKLTPIDWSESSAESAHLDAFSLRRGQIGFLRLVNLVEGVSTIHPYTAEEPYWIIEVEHQGGSFTGVAAVAAESILRLWDQAAADVESAGPAASAVDEQRAESAAREGR
jgi:hypothetical protein